MNVFVLCAGRCASMTFAHACDHMTNYTAAHESRRHRDNTLASPRQRVAGYPDNHIEVDNRLAWMLGMLESEYGDDAFYVHLIRDQEEVARSFLKRWDSRDGNIIYSYAWGTLSYRFDQVNNMSEAQRLGIARDYWELVNGNIQGFVANKLHHMTIWLHDIKEAFEEFWHRIGAEGDLSAALEEWDVSHNASAKFDAENLSPNSPVTVTSVSGTGSTHDIVSVSNSTSRMKAGTGDIPHDLSEEVLNPRGALRRAAKSYRSVKLPRDVEDSLGSSWSLTPETLKYITALIILLRPKHILEFGSGVSTNLLLQATDKIETSSFISSIDHDPDFIADMSYAGQLASNGRLSIQLAPLVSRKFGERFLPAYRIDTNELATLDPVELCVVDGPPVSLGGREGTLYQLMELSKPGTCLLLDDSHRPEERKALAGWESAFGNAIEIHDISGFRKGLTAVIIRHIVKPPEVWRHMITQAAHDINRVMPLGVHALLIDECQWSVDLDDILNVSVERDYSFPPASGIDAVNALRNHLSNGVDVVIFGWPAYWWFDHFKELEPFLDNETKTVFKNNRVAVYDLRQTSD